MALSDADVIEASLADPAAFAAIFDRHAVTLRRFLARRIEPADADNLLGEVFRIAFERRGSFDLARESARPWLYGIATNLIARYRRSEARRLRALATLAGRRLDVDQDIVGERAVDAAAADESWTTLATALDGLPHIERHTLLLYAWEALSYDEIAAALDVPVGTVRSRLNRARRRLRGATDCASPPVRARHDEHGRSEEQPR